MQFDAALKQILQFSNSRLVEILAGSPVRQWLNVEFPQTQMRRVDLLAELETGQIFHVELQSRNDTRIGKRLLEYRLLIEQKYGKSPLQLLLYVGPEPMTMSGLLEEGGLRFEYAARDIREFEPAALLTSPLIEDRILSILCRVKDPNRTAMEVLKDISLLPQPARGDALAKLLVLSGLRRLHPEILQEIKQMPLYENPLENPFLFDLFMEGKAEGRAAEAIRITTQILQRRFGPLPAWATDKIQNTPVAQLEKILDQALDAPTLERAFDSI